MNRIALLCLFALTACGGGSPATDAGFDLQNPPAKSVRVTVSGEALASEGFAFPPTAGQEVFFEDGWQVTLSRVLVTVDQVTLSENPDLSPTDQSKTGDVVAQLDGPWAVDLVKGGGLGGPEANAVAITGTATLNKKGGAAFDATKRYAFGYALGGANPDALNANLDDAAQVDYVQMANAGHSILFVGTAEWKGTSCRQSVAGYDFARLPKKVEFRFGFAAPTTYVNCLNPSLGDEVRGVQVKENAAVDAQITLHLDHPFWEALQEDAPLRWDVIAARKSAALGMSGAASVSVTEADLVGLDFQAVKDAQAIDLPWRYCGPQTTGERTSGTVGYDPKGVPVNAAGGTAGLKDLAEYMRLNLSSFGHLNADGLCFPQRKFPAP